MSAGRARPIDLFFSTELAPCPYLADRRERRLVTLLGGAAEARHDQLIRAGFRRSQNLAYRPACPGCRACVPVRIPAADFRLHQGWRKILRRNRDLAVQESQPVASEEQFALFRRYLEGRHAAGGMAEMSWADYRAMVNETPVDSLIVEWRRPDRSLIAVSLTDRCASGLSGVYKFFDPTETRRSLGTQIILWHIVRAGELGLPYVYLGYWIADSPKMAYKARFRPLEQLTPEGWRPLEPEAATEPAPQEAVALAAET